MHFFGKRHVVTNPLQVVGKKTNGWMRIGNFFSRGHESSSSHGCSVANCGVSSGNIGGRHSKLTFGILFFFVTTWGSKRDPNYSYRSSLFHTLEDDKATLPAQHSPKSNARVDH